MEWFISATPLDDPSTRWILIGFGTMAVVYLVTRGFGRKRRDPLERAPIASSLSQQRAVEREMNNLLVELSEMSRQISSQLDTRAAKLEVLIREADEKIATLQHMPTNLTYLPNSQTPTIDSALENPPDNPVANIPEIPPDPRHLRIYELADKGRSSNEIAHELGQPNGEIELILALRPRG